MRKKLVGKEEKKKYAHFLNPLQFFNLNYSVFVINKAFKKFGFGTFLVGSSLKNKNFRDVDIRCIIQDKYYEQLFPGINENQSNHPFWSLFCMSISEWLSNRTGLPIDFQIQKISDKQNIGGGIALGILPEGEL